ncbi:MAG: Ada metal-binding domain-containing protein [Candidatus Moranbacteria bacterium]|nr:Ada metal-binding domain-containing protein [Candidatus Moranbacteria bacterium]
MSTDPEKPKNKIVEFWLKYEQKILVIFGIILIAAISYEAGFLEGRKNQEEPVVINQIASDNSENENIQKENSIPADDNNPKTGQTNSQTTGSPAGQTTEKQDCAFVASKTSDKYHLPTCAWAKKIKPENRICFSSKEEAESKGYKPAKCCIK